MSTETKSERLWYGASISLVFKAMNLVWICWIMKCWRALSSLRGLRGAPEVPPLCRQTSVSRTANVGTVGKKWLWNKSHPFPCNGCLPPCVYVPLIQAVLQYIYRLEKLALTIQETPRHNGALIKSPINPRIRYCRDVRRVSAPLWYYTLGQLQA